MSREVIAHLSADGPGRILVKPGIAEVMNVGNPRGGGFALHRAFDLGRAAPAFDLSGDEKEPAVYDPLPAGHRFFPDCERETNARFIEWTMTRLDGDAWFVTLTFRRYVSPAAAYIRLRTWLGRLRVAYEHTTRCSWLNWICAAEWQKRAVIHFHVIVAGARLDELSRIRWERRWEGDLRGGFARIHDARKKAAPYLAKYTSKAQGGDLAWHLTSRGFTVPKSVSCCRA